MSGCPDPNLTDTSTLQRGVDWMLSHGAVEWLRRLDFHEQWPSRAGEVKALWV